MPGIPELLVIAAILFLLVGVPVVVIVIVLVVVNRSKSRTYDDVNSETENRDQANDDHD